MPLEASRRSLYLDQGKTAGVFVRSVMKTNNWAWTEIIPWHMSVMDDEGKENLPGNRGWCSRWDSEQQKGRHQQYQRHRCKAASPEWARGEDVIGNQVFPDLEVHKCAACPNNITLLTKKHTHMSVIQEGQSLGNVVESEEAVRRRPEPVKLIQTLQKECLKGKVWLLRKHAECWMRRLIQLSCTVQLKLQPAAG